MRAGPCALASAHSYRSSRPTARALDQGPAGVQVVHGLLFVWGEAGPSTLLESLQSQPAAVAELLEPEKLVIGSPW